MMTESVLLLGNYRPTITLARELKPLGYRIIVTRGGGEGLSEYSRFVDECWDHPPVEDETAFVGALQAFLRDRPNIRIILPVWEPCALQLAHHRESLPDDRIYAAPNSDTVIACLDKMHMLSFAKSSNVPIAEFAIVDNHSRLADEAERIGYPLIVRPATSSLELNGEKVLISSNQEELLAELPAWPSGHDELIVQEYVTGPRYNLYFAAQRGRPVRFLSAEILRTHKANGTGLAVEGATIALDPDIRQYGENLIKALDYDGVGCIQFIVDRESGKVTFLELNPRIAGNHAVAEYCGLELGRLSIDLARTPEREEPFFVGNAGVHYAWTYGELRGIVESLSNGQLKPGSLPRAIALMIRNCFATDVHMTWRWDDPLPTLALFLRQVPGIKTLVNRSSAARRPEPAAPEASNCATKAQV